MEVIETVKSFPCTFPPQQAPDLQQQYSWTAMVIKINSQKRAWIEEKWKFVFYVKNIVELTPAAGMGSGEILSADWWSIFHSGIRRQW